MSIPTLDTILRYCQTVITSQCSGGGWGGVRTGGVTLIRDGVYSVCAVTVHGNRSGAL